ncbi:MAG: metal ABC transporter permease [Candidatus Melainabacteria bacterium HGW-Melainabacteria-1]|nr:MAG: metal ABC transporter permease [Candidatus Melainabacteria bacterium HGW-Melainabacteria-1]
MIELFLPAFAVSVVLLGIHSYFGLEIIRRGIIFTDLAIGQMAALGTAVALLLFEGHFVYPVSLAFALLTGLLIGLLSRRERNVEPLIGLLYALGLAGVFLLLSRSPHGVEEMQNLMAYDILFTPLTAVGQTAVLYAGIGLVLWLTRNLQGLARELIFFVCFAATVTSSVKLAGVLVVFALLVAPALLAAYLPVRHKLATAWLLGTLVNLAAMALSFYADLPTGYTVVFAQTLVALLAGLTAIACGRSLDPRAEPQTDSPG